MSGLRRRLEDLERNPPRPHEGPSPARERMIEHLNRIAALRRSGATVENNCELRAMRIDAKRYIAKRRGEGGS